MTAQGMRAYLVKMGGILGPALSLTLMNAQAEYLKTGSWEPIDDKHAALFTLIFDRIVPALEGHDGLIVRMSQKCGTNGPKALHWLTIQLDPQTEASSVLKLIQVFQKQLSSDNMISDMQQLISANDTLAGSDFHLNAKIISSLLLAKLPSAHTATRASIVQRAEIPSPDDIITIFTTTLGFDAAGQESTNPSTFRPSAFAAFPAKPKSCRNCDSTEHLADKCPKPKAACEACGLFAGHLPKYCLVINDTPLPTAWDEVRKAGVLEKRKAYKELKNNNSANMCYPHDSAGDFNEDFWTALRQANQ